MSVDVGSAKGYLDLDISGFLSSLKTAQSEADSSSKKIANDVGKNISSIGKKISSAGSSITKSITLPLAGVSVAGIKVASDFEKNMSEVKAISGATGKEFDKLREKAIDLGAKTAFSANEVANAMTEMAKAGWDSSQIIDGMSGVLDAAAASGEGLATVSTIVADAITGFGLEAKESTKIADLLTQAANSGTIGITDLGESFKYIAPIAGSMGLSVEDVTTALSAMSMAGIKGSQAGTALRTMLARMVKPTDDVASVMDKLGISVTNQDGSMKSLDDIVSNLRKSFDGLTESEKAKYAATLAGQEGMSGMLSLLNLTEEEYDKIAQSMDNASGVAEKTASVMQDNLQSKVEQLGGSLESLAIKLSDNVIPYVQDFVIWLTNLIDKFTELDPETQKTILAIGGIAMAIGPGLVAIGKMATGVSSLISTVGSLKEGFASAKTAIKSFNAMQALQAAKTKIVTAAQTALNVVMNMNPIGLIVAAIAALVAAFIYLWNNCEGFRNFFINMWENIQSAFQAFLDFISPAIETIKGFFISLWEKMQEIWAALKESLQPLVEELTGAFQMAWDVIKLIWDYVEPYFSGIWEGIKAVFSIVSSWFSTIFGVAWEGIKLVWGVVVSWFTLLWENIKVVFSVVGTWFKSIFSVAWEAIKAVWNVVVAFFTTIWAGIKAVFAVVKGVLSGNFSDAWDAIKNVWDKVKNFFSSIWEGIKNVFGAVVNFFKNVFGSAWEGIKKIFGNVGSFFTGIWDKIKNAFSAIGTKIGDAISGAVKSGINGILGMIEGVVNTFVGMINGAINLINLIPGVNIGYLQELSIPRLARGGVVNRATIAEIGEDGKEAIVPLEKNLGWMKSLVKEFANRFSVFFNKHFEFCQEILEISRKMMEINSGYVPYGGFTKSRFSNGQYDFVEHNREGQGDTYNFYSPEPIDEIEAAKQMKKAKRELAEGY